MYSLRNMKMFLGKCLESNLKITIVIIMETTIPNDCILEISSINYWVIDILNIYLITIS